MSEIILLEDDQVLREDLTQFFSRSGHAVHAVSCVSEFEKDFIPAMHIMAILDLGLPDGDGMEIIAKLRQRNLKLGIIVLTGRCSLAAKVEGLLTGADYYLSKTTSLEEIIATVDALARRLTQGGLSANWVLDCKRLLLIPPGQQPIELSAQDFIVLNTIIEGHGQPIKKRAIITALGADFLSYDQRRLDTQMNRLRRKVRDMCDIELPIKTLRDRGYQFYEPIMQK